MTEFGERLKDARERAGLTAYELSQRTGVDAQTIRRVERGETDPRLTTALILAAGVGKRINELTGPLPELPEYSPPPRGRRPKKQS